MKLYFRKIGEGRPLLFLHGVFGSSDNLYRVSKNIADKGYAVYTLDARNHGLSPRADEFNYELMAADLHMFIKDEGLEHAAIMGHSMGGKTVMQYAQNYPVQAPLIVVDIAPRFYPTHHDHIIAGLRAIDVNTLTNRKEAEEIFGQYVTDFGEKQFILKNLFRTENGGFDWRINVPVISENMYLIGQEIPLQTEVSVPTLFIRGSDSSYISDADFKEAKQGFKNAELLTLEGANHWVHATQPVKFVEAVVSFLERNK